MSELSSQGVDIRPPESFDVYNNKSVYSVNVTLEKGFYTNHLLSSDPEIVVNNCLPTEYHERGQYKIGFSYWESDRIPSSWEQHISRMDEIWTTSNFAKKVYSQYHDNVHSFSLGIDSEIFVTNTSPPITNKFTFLHVGAPSKRKNSQMVVDAFLEAFGGNSSYHLIIKSIGPPECRLHSGGSIIGAVKDHPQITVIDIPLSDKSLADLYASVHCLVYPTYGEGWGMIPFQAIAVGTPTICTELTSCEEFAHLSVPLPAKWTDKHSFGIYRGSKWAYPLIEDVIDRMKYVASSYDAIKEKTLQGAAIIHKEYNWSKVASEYKNRLCQI